MRLASISLQEMIEGVNRGWGDRDSRSPMMLQEERAGVQVRTTKEAIQEALENE
jgi:3-hydroxyisobutyrate dehydrogenase